MLASTKMPRLIPRLNAIHPPRIQAVGLRHSSGHGPVYTPPTGYLFNERPPRKGKKRRREDWEPYMWIYFGICIFAAVGIATKPRQGIQDWALVQAKLRMEEDGVNLDYKVD